MYLSQTFHVSIPNVSCIYPKRFMYLSQTFHVSIPNEMHQADLMFLPHDRVRHKTYKYALIMVNVASRCKEAEPLTSNDSTEVASALSRIYSRGPLKLPKLLQVDPGREFMGSVSQTQSMASQSDEAKERLVVCRLLWSGSTGPWQSDTLGTSMLKRCGCQRDRGQLNGRLGCLRSSLT